MDPDETLRMIRERQLQILADTNRYNDETVEIAELIKNLDDWICNGGFLPTSWTRR